ncbi:hypothetical protein, partial [Myroides sp. 1372]|uniref:hypothetical protein n=1 Tax=Myroides sp. 1372 TaxID=2746737 RepID=UPI002574B666
SFPFLRIFTFCSLLVVGLLRGLSIKNGYPYLRKIQTTYNKQQTPHNIQHTTYNSPSHSSIHHCKVLNFSIKELRRGIGTSVIEVV